MNMEQQFRSALFGGFNRQDVLTYIETAAKAHAQDMGELQNELDKVKQAAEEMTARLADAEAQVTALTPRAAQMEKATAELEEKRPGLAAAEREMRELRAKVAALEPKAAAYDAVKDKTAGIELEAHQRARQVTDEAERRAKEMASQTDQWLARVRGSYERLRTDVEATVNHTAGELERAGKALATVNKEFRDHDAAMKALTETNKGK